MKKIFLLIFLAIMVFILINRQRVYVRDPLATVYENDVKQSGVQVYINYSNDVLLEKDGDGGTLVYRYLVQSWNRMPGSPVVLKCLHWIACLADADHASTYRIEAAKRGPYEPKVAMSNREVTFVDGGGTTMRVVLR
jgi:hypothetical protein